MHTAESLFREFEKLLLTKPLPVSGWHFVHVHCRHVECLTRAGMQPGLRPHPKAGADGYRWLMCFDARDTHPKRNRDAIRFGVKVLLHDRFHIPCRDIPFEALTELELRLEVLMLGDGEYVPFAEECGITPLLALASGLPLAIASVTAIRRPKHPSERQLERHAVTIAKMYGVFRAELGH